MRFDVITLFPELFEIATRHGVTGRAVKKGRVTLALWNPRDYTHDRHRTVDDRPYGGGPGMVMMVPPLRETLRAARAAAPTSRVVYLSPQGCRLDQAAEAEMAAVTRLLPGVLGHELSAEQDSFVAGLLDHPHYTRPEEIDGQRVPAVLLQGNHEATRRWRLKQALGRTWRERPDLLQGLALTREQQALLDEFKRERGA